MCMRVFVEGAAGSEDMPADKLLWLESEFGHKVSCSADGSAMNFVNVIKKKSSDRTIIQTVDRLHKRLAPRKTVPRSLIKQRIALGKGSAKKKRPKTKKGRC